MDAFEPLRDLSFKCTVVVVNPVDAVATYDDPTLVYEWASVAKLITTYAALIAVDRGMAALGEPAGPDGSTLRHLLAHASGLPFTGRTTQGVVGARRVYSNSGIEMAAEHVESRVGMPFAQWVKATVLGPLGMDTAEFYGSPSKGMRGSAVDLAEFARAVLNGALVKPATYTEATTPVIPYLSGVLPGYGRQDPNLWGLGFEIRGHKEPHWTGHNNSPRTFGHFGWEGSFMWVDPAVHLAAVFLGEEPFGPTHQAIWPDLSDRILAVHSAMT
ncbi:MAG TPA: serine hydrolase domain-containing protein [Actinomycetaceae bacterium]|nr:serine hydrolase domain-containing protein [Actinomycetaceae bacterium]